MGVGSRTSLPYQLQVQRVDFLSIMCYNINVSLIKRHKKK